MPRLAFIVCALLIAWLFASDAKKHPGHSASLWIPFAWMFLAGSRYASSWLDLRPPMASVSAYADGSDVDRAAFFALIAAAMIVLARRELPWRLLLGRNKWLVLYFVYCLVSVAWSDEPYVLLKRWIKDLGNPLMVLVILTDPRPYEAAATIMRRLSFVFLPLSFLFCRYFPELGRAYHDSGSPMYTGIGQQKNDLGTMCLIAGIYLSWKLLQSRRLAGTKRGSLSAADVLLAGLAALLLYMSNSQTSLACLIVVMLLFLATRVPLIARAPSRIVGWLAFSVAAAWALENRFGLTEIVYGWLGRDATLTNRATLWAVVLALEVNSVIGAGFMSFWSGERMAIVWDKLGNGINQAHNGYLEQYLNLGYIGIAFIAIIMLSSLMKIRRHMVSDPSAAMLRLSFVVTGALYNLTEASFYGINNIWLLFLLGAIDVQGCSKKATEQRLGALLTIPLIKLAAKGRR